MTHKSLWVCSCCLYKFQKRIFDPLLDRIDIHIEMSRVDYEKLNGDRMGETSESIRARVQAAHNIQLKRFANIEGKYPFTTSRYIKEIRYQTVNRTCKAITW